MKTVATVAAILDVGIKISVLTLNLNIFFLSVRCDNRFRRLAVHMLCIYKIRFVQYGIVNVHGLHLNRLLFTTLYL